MCGGRSAIDTFSWKARNGVGAFCSFQNHLMYIFHAYLSAAWPHPEAAAPRAGGSHRSKYFTLPNCALSFSFCAWLPWLLLAAMVGWECGWVTGSESCRAVASFLPESPGAEAGDEEVGMGELCLELSR